MKNIRIAFFGNPEPSVTVLSALLNAGHTITCTVTKPPRPVGRSQILTPTPVALWANDNSVPIIDATTGEKPWLFADKIQLINQVKKYAPDLIVAADFTLKIPRELVTAARFGGLNIHPSLLPAFAGPSPVAYAILNGLPQTGVSVITLSEKLDQGTIIAQEKESVSPIDTTPTLTQRLFTKGSQLLIKVLPNYVAGSCTPIQSQTQPSYAPRLTRQDGFVPWNNLVKAITNNESLAVAIERKSRAFTPWPGVWTEIISNKTSPNKSKRLKILSCHISPDNKHLLLLDTIQLEGKKPISGEDVTSFLMQIKSEI